MIIDAHTHLFASNIAKIAIPKLSNISKIEPFTDGTKEDAIVKMKQNNIDKAVVYSVATKPNAESKINDYLLQLDKNIFIPFGAINPFSENVVKILNFIKNNNFKGIKLHPQYQNFELMQKELCFLYDACIDLDLIVTFHAGWDVAYPTCENANAVCFAKMLDKYYNLKAILAHFGGLRQGKEVINYLAGRKNICFDTAICKENLPLEIANEIIKKHGADKIFFGTDCPWDNFASVIAYLKKLDLSEQEFDNIMSNNLIKFLNLNAK
ncbi:MAG: amidohydrolase family protein [Clostridia bacterium]